MHVALAIELALELTFARLTLRPPRARAPRAAVSLGDGIDYHQRHGHVGEVICDTLAKLEAAGGPDAFINIKYLVSDARASLSVIAL